MRLWIVFLICTRVAVAQSVADHEPGEATPISLVQAEQWMREKSPQLAQVKFAYEGSAADVVIAGESPNPQLSVNTSAINYRAGVGSGPLADKQMDSVLRLDQTIERGDKRDKRLQVARIAERAAAADYADSWRTSRLTLANDYFDLKYAQEVESLDVTLANIAGNSLQAARQRLQDGDMSRVDVARLEVEVARAEADLVAARTNQRTAQVVLATQIGLNADTVTLQAVDDWPAPINALASAASATTRPDVQAALARQAQALAAVDLARAQRSRDITVGVQFEHYPQPGVVSPNSLGVGFSIPLFLRNHYEGEIDRATADRRAADEVARATALAANNDQQQAALAMSGAREHVNAFRDSVLESARSAAAAAEYAYAHGALGLTDLLDARRAMQAVLLEALNANAEYAKAQAAWRAATDTDSLQRPSKP